MRSLFGGGVDIGTVGGDALGRKLHRPIADAPDGPDDPECTKQAGEATEEAQREKKKVSHSSIAPKSDGCFVKPWLTYDIMVPNF